MRVALWERRYRRGTNSKESLEPFEADTMG
jgi:hypothetical protein